MIDNQEQQIIDCYTDASYSKEVGGSIIAYKINNMPIRSKYLNGVKNTEAEIKGVDRCIEIASDMYLNSEIHIYTDCQKVLELKAEGKYPDNVIVHKMKGHMKGALRDNNQHIFSQVDKRARKLLRIRLKAIRASDLNKVLTDKQNDKEQNKVRVRKSNKKI